MSGAAAAPAGFAVSDARGASFGWSAWLDDHIDPQWRPGEWRQEVWFFDGDVANDRTLAWACMDCGRPVRRRTAPCGRCRNRPSLASGAEGGPRWSPVPARCLVDGCQCVSNYRGVCYGHTNRWQAVQERNPGTVFEDWLTDQQPIPRPPDCVVMGCCREQMTDNGLCGYHYNRLCRQRPVAGMSRSDVAEWAARETPFENANQFSLAGMTEITRRELLYALQQRDRGRQPVDPLLTRGLIARLGGRQTWRDLDVDAFVAQVMKQNTGGSGLLRDLCRHVDRAYVAFSGSDPTRSDVWDLRLLDLRAASNRLYAATGGTVDFTQVRQVWLRELFKEWARSVRPTVVRLRNAVLAAVTASFVLSERGRSDPSTLSAGDFDAVVSAIRDRRQGDGSAYSAANQGHLLSLFFEVIQFGRADGLMDDVPGGFSRARHHRVSAVEDDNEDEIGKALPDRVIRILDEHVDLIGRAGARGPVAGADLELWHATMYRILRDTGRRPNEVVSLKVGCVEVIDGQFNLIYDNHKAGRMRRRLPITARTAEAILAWERRRQALPFPESTKKWLFPTPMLATKQNTGHISAAYLAQTLREWVRKIPAIDVDQTGRPGHPMAFDRRLITPYSFRHSYAQRHADAGVPVDVLRDLMDHKSVNTTMGYYKISLKRKQQAIRTVGALAIDREGNPNPFVNAVAYQRASVAVPFGNCTEPSNVAAGGGSCPIRFQCAGCGFYRPDPSYLPAVEEHIASLCADRETATAMEAAQFVIDSLTAQIESFQAAADTMRRTLAGMPTDQRHEVEEASRLLRRDRGARRIPVAIEQSSQREAR